jgi:D-serine deaminase-like pyridoxal phosphate-dependent protein
MSADDILRYFDFEPVGRRLEDLETPVPIIDIDVVANNLKRWQARCDKAGFGNRPHIKTHKLVPLAKAQIGLGAKGITVQKLGEAEVMADAGISDMLLTFNIIGDHKLRRLAELAKRTEIKVVADNEVVVEGLGRAGAMAGRPIDVLVECDTGMKRNGVQSPEAAAALARNIDATKGLRFGGLMTYPKPGIRREVAAFIGEARDLIAKSGLETSIITTGGAPEMWRDDGLDVITEYRTGTYVFFDRSLVERGVCSRAECGLSVLATVVSRPTADRAMIDAGTKSLTSDLLGLQGYGIIPELGDAKIYEANEEHGYVDISATQSKPAVGDLVRVLPNHVCPVMNLFDRVVFVRGDDVLGRVKVDARGHVQ